MEADEWAAALAVEHSLHTGVVTDGGSFFDPTRASFICGRRLPCIENIVHVPKWSTNMADEIGGWNEPGFHYYYVAADLWRVVTAQKKEGKSCHLQLVPEGQDAYKTAGAAGTWMGKSRIERIHGIYIVGHGGPGVVHVGKDLKADSIAPLGGWLASFMMPEARVRVLGCASAADSMQDIGEYVYGQMHTTANDRPGYDLLFELAYSTKRIAEGALNGQSNNPLGLKAGCRRVFPNGKDAHFWGMGMKDPNER
jgi:hypothetical protein